MASTINVDFLGDNLGDSLGDDLGDFSGEATPLTILGDRCGWWGNGSNYVLGVAPDVQAQTDLATAGQDIIQGTDTKRPHVSTAISGYDSLLYTAANAQALAATGLTLYGAGQYAGMWVAVQLATVAAEQTIFSFGVGTQFRLYHRIASTDWRCQMGTTGGAKTMQTVGVSDTGIHLFFCWADATTCYLDVDDGAEVATDATTDGTMLAAGTGVQASGRGAVEYLDGHMFEQVGFIGDTPPTVAERAAMRAYFTGKYPTLP